jgi:predicted outer membrane protein
MRMAAAAMLALLLAPCAEGRPRWADGRFITEERPAGQGPQDLRDLEARRLAIHNRARADVEPVP